MIAKHREKQRQCEQREQQRTSKWSLPQWIGGISHSKQLQLSQLSDLQLHPHVHSHAQRAQQIVWQISQLDHDVFFFYQQLFRLFVDTIVPKPVFPLMDRSLVDTIFTDSLVEIVDECWIAPTLTEISISRRSQTLPLLKDVVERLTLRQCVHLIRQAHAVTSSPFNLSSRERAFDTYRRNTSINVNVNANVNTNSNGMYNDNYLSVSKTSCMSPHLALVVKDLFPFFQQCLAKWPLDLITHFHTVQSVHLYNFFFCNVYYHYYYYYYFV
ncbi:hypothetical protein RFI_20250 [Reticulomyxa filosa]|uniref:Uncharacterized protein n=1 Tax=Reticulomyxa filosa TaxID=46433 RepID=X6MSX3_RETFI|nr:hypothetical protein RFI_20250 [Reticulomyxa filosa]|eukprot:ETO17083.1 hypothetical protein RFI_20250 [Reticulomyxa filosa]